MSMWLEFAKLSKATVDAADKDPGIYESIFMEGTGPSDFSGETDVIGLDYRMYAGIAEAIGDGVEIDEQETWTAKATSVGAGEEIDFEFCYGPGWKFSIEEVSQIAAGLVTEGWDPDDDYEENVARFFKKAADEGKCIVGGIN